MKWIALAAIGIAAWPSSAAHACSLSPCFLRVFPASGELPANMVKLRYTEGPGRGNQETPPPQLYRMEGAEKVSVPFEREPITPQTSWLVPTESLPAGTTLLLEGSLPTSCGESGSPLSATYTITAAAPLATSLGTLSSTNGSGRIQVESDGPCSEQVDAAYADVRVELTSAAQPYAALFAYQTYLDGRPIARFTTSSGGGERPQGEDRLFTVCGDAGSWVDGVSPGEHSVRWEGTLPNGAKLSTDELTITLHCAGPNARPDAGTDAATIGDGSVQLASNDDGCALAPRSTFSGALVALALLLGHRRKRSP